MLVGGGVLELFSDIGERGIKTIYNELKVEHLKEQYRYWKQKYDGLLAAFECVEKEWSIKYVFEVFGEDKIKAAKKLGKIQRQLQKYGYIG